MKRSLLRRMQRYSTMYLFLLPAIIVSLIFYYRPMIGLIMAFQKYDIVKGMFDSPFVGLDNFRAFIDDSDFWSALWNTLAINGLYILFGFPLPIALAIMIFGMRDNLFKKVTQTISYLPHFVSWVVIAGIVYKLLDVNSGIVNILIKNLGGTPVAFMREPDYFWWIMTITSIWKELGWNTIIYLAALASIDATQYEAAMVDGANSFQQLLYITLPGLAPIIGLMLIFTIGTLVSSNSAISFDAIYNMRNAIVASQADTLDYYIYSKGVLGVKYGLSTAAGLLLSLISLFLVLGSNAVSRRIRGYGAF
ncbi:MAG: sugar ABC transporter permease [Caldilinea sp. CFX5]|nr:sugar ABC transporter permease [Caldilinea sp. CFX5]